MKKKVLIVLGAIALVVLLTINVTFITKDSKSELSLNAMGMILQADAEDTTPSENQECKEDSCSTTLGTATYYGHYKHCGYGGGSCSFSSCWVGCDAL